MRNGPLRTFTPDHAIIAAGLIVIFVTFCDEDVSAPHLTQALKRLFKP